MSDKATAVLEDVPNAQMSVPKLSKRSKASRKVLYAGYDDDDASEINLDEDRIKSAQVAKDSAKVETRQSRIDHRKVKPYQWTRLQECAHEFFILRNRRYLVRERETAEFKRFLELLSVFKKLGADIGPELTEQQLIDWLRSREEAAKQKKDIEPHSQQGVPPENKEQSSASTEPDNSANLSQKGAGPDIESELERRAASEVLAYQLWCLEEQVAKSKLQDQSSNCSTDVSPSCGQGHYGSTTINGGNAVVGDVHAGTIHVTNERRSRLEVLATSLIGGAAGGVIGSAAYATGTSGYSYASTRPESTPSSPVPPTTAPVFVPLTATAAVPTLNGLPMRCSMEYSSKSSRSKKSTIVRPATSSSFASPGPHAAQASEKVLLLIDYNLPARNAKSLLADLNRVFEVRIASSTEALTSHLSALDLTAILIQASIFNKHSLDTDRNAQVNAAAIAKFTLQGGITVLTCVDHKGFPARAVTDFFADNLGLKTQTMNYGQRFDFQPNPQSAVVISHTQPHERIQAFLESLSRIWSFCPQVYTLILPGRRGAAGIGISGTAQSCSPNTVKAE